MDDRSLLGRLPLESFGTVTSVEESAGFVGARAISDRSVVELYPDIVRTLQNEGYTFVGGDNEGFEAELSFEDARRRSVTFTLRRAGCEGEVAVHVLLQRKVGA